MDMGSTPTWLRQVSPPPLHKTTLTTGCRCGYTDDSRRNVLQKRQLKQHHMSITSTSIV